MGGKRGKGDGTSLGQAPWRMGVTTTVTNPCPPSPWGVLMASHSCRLLVLGGQGVGTTLSVEVSVTFRDQLRPSLPSRSITHGILPR